MDGKRNPPPLSNPLLHKPLSVGVLYITNTNDVTLHLSKFLDIHSPQCLITPYHIVPHSNLSITTTFQLSTLGNFPFKPPITTSPNSSNLSLSVNLVINKYLEGGVALAYRTVWARNAPLCYYEIFLSHQHTLFHGVIQKWRNTFGPTTRDTIWFIIISSEGN